MTQDSPQDSQAGAYAFPDARALPINDAAQVEQAIASFNDVPYMDSDARDMAWARIGAAAAQYGVRMPADNWRQLPGAQG